MLWRALAIAVTILISTPAFATDPPLSLNKAGVLLLLASQEDNNEVVVATIIGKASWYGPGFHGQRTAFGEVFNQDALTAAHPTLRAGTMVRVTNLANDRAIIVRINDRGPFRKNRVIDVAKEAARQLGFVKQGVVKVRVEVLQSANE